MTQEREARSEPLKIGDGEKLPVLQQLQGHEDERLRAIGLNNFYLQMADPSVEFLETASSSLVGMPSASLRELQFATYNAGDNPRGFFAKHGIVVDDTERLLAGISNSGELIENIVHSWGEKLNTKILPESTYERIQIRNGERRIKKMAERIYNEPNLRRRYRMGLDLRRQVLDYVDSFNFTFKQYYRDEPIEPTWENLAGHSGLSTEFKTKDGSITTGNFGLGEEVYVAEAAITRYPFEKKLEKLPTRDKERFDQLRLEYGSKAANLIILSELVKDINKPRRGLFNIELIVPDFQIVSVDLYRAWKEGKLIDSNLQPYYEWASRLKDPNRWHFAEQLPADYIVRSSAVFSEDGEKITGAGVYDSVRVSGGAAFEDFKDAVVKVYESTNSSQAQVYRTQHGIDGEEMGLVVQKYVSPHNYSLHGQSQTGYINSRLTGLPQLMEIVTKTSRNFVKRKELEFFLALDADGNKDAFKNVHHFPPDQYRVRPDLPIRVAQLTSVIERIWEKDIQIEFVVDGLTVNVVQVRELPASEGSQMPEIQFPNEIPIHSGASIGVGDMELPVVNDRDDNSEKTGIAIFESNLMWSMGLNNHRLPKNGIVIITNSDGGNGHIQTLCAEKGLICVFPDMNEEGKPTLSYHELSEFKKVRVVSNGIEARVYRVI